MSAHCLHTSRASVDGFDSTSATGKSSIVLIVSLTSVLHTGQRLASHATITSFESSSSLSSLSSAFVSDDGSVGTIAIVVVVVVVVGDDDGDDEADEPDDGDNDAEEDVGAAVDVEVDKVLEEDVNDFSLGCLEEADSLLLVASSSSTLTQESQRI